MRILFLSTWHPYPSTNGSKLRARYLLEALAAQHNVTVLAFRPSYDGRLETNDQCSDSQLVTAVRDDPFRYSNAPRWIKYLSPSPLVFRGSAAMREAVLSMAHEVWDAVVAVQMPVAQYAARVNAKGRVIDVDTALTYQMWERYRSTVRLVARASAWVSWQKSRRYEARMLRRFRTAIVVSSKEIEPLEEMVDARQCRVAMVPNGVDCRHNHPGVFAPKAGTLVYNGSLTYSANYDAMHWFLADVYPRVKAQVPGVSLIITGSVAGVNMRGLRLDESVRLTGFVDDVRVPVAGATACIAPIRQGGGTRLKILEAMALGTPVVATAKGAEGLDVIDGEHLLLADAPESFARCTTALLQDEALRCRLAASARKLVEARYDWQGIGARFVSLVEEAARAHA